MHDKFEVILAALDTLSPGVLKASCALLMTGEGTGTVAHGTSTVRSRWDDFDRIETAADLFLLLKRHFQFQELSALSVEGGKIYVEVGNRKVELPSSIATSKEKPRGLPTMPQVHTVESGRFGNLELES